MAEPISVSNEEASIVLQVIFDQLQQYRAVDVLHGIEESRRLGIEEDVSKEMEGRASELKRVGLVRRRPPTNLEMLRIVFGQLRQRLIVLPAIVNALEQRLGGNQLVWRIDREFVSPDLVNTFEAEIDDLRSPGIDQIATTYERVRELIPALVPARTTESI
jgi:hypothetical protein